MKVKMVGFKVGKSRPTANKTIDLGEKKYDGNDEFKSGYALLVILRKSDFVSVRRVDE